MKKKQYSYPVTLVEILNTQELMAVSSVSETPIDPGMTPAPRRRTEVF